MTSIHFYLANVIRMVISQIDPQNFQASITYPVTLSPVFGGFIGGSESQIKTI